MMSLSTVEARLPPGFRFHPKDEELICNYLMNWVAGSSAHHCSLLLQVDLNKSEPWDIPEAACIGGKEWYFYSQRDRKYATGVRTNRATVSGYWKATGKDRPVVRKGTLVGLRKTLVFYEGRAPKGRKTEWVMHEFRLGALEPDVKHVSSNKEDWVLCRMFYKSRSEIPNKQENGSFNNQNQITNPLSMEPYNNIPIQQTNYFQQQVACFSNNYIQTNPNTTFSTISHDASHQEYANNFEQMTPKPAFIDPSCDKRMIGAMFNQLSKTESVNDNQPLINGSPSIGEGSSESYLSEERLSSIWNQDVLYG